MELGRALAQPTTSTGTDFDSWPRNRIWGACHLIEVSRTVEALAIPRDQLGKIGLPKLQLIATHLTPITLDALLHLAEQSTVNDLEYHVRGWKKPAGNADCVLMYFSSKSYEKLEETLKSNDAAPGAAAAQ
jgi:hypothetical protein